MSKDRKKKSVRLDIGYARSRIAIVYVLMLASFFLSDWKLPIGGIAFSDLFVIMTLGITSIDIKYLKRKQVLFILGLISILSLNICANYLFNPVFELGSAWIYFGKFIIYSLTLCNLYNLTREYRMESVLFKFLSIGAIISVTFALLIYLIQTLHLSIPYEFLWKFTRSDVASYTFRGSSIIRMRGLSSEPSYFGGQIILILTINYFNQFNFRFNPKVEFLILACGILSFSFSVVPVLILLKIFDFLNRYGLDFLRKYWFVLLLILSIGVVIVFFDQFYITFFDRIIMILNKGDTSASSRLVGSWQYVQNIFIGNGVGKTPAIWNNFAYVLSDFGLIPFLVFLLGTLYIVKENFYFGIFFIMISFQKGGYLSFYYWLIICFFLIFSKKNVKTRKEGVSL
ncbi:hypothetical protein [Enterococcus gilvus]|uniref:hypothetical protein n=1 Tax=Enterococcus gilvus TaxID=160453 RepID=UPI001C8BC05C|nr:hypothetical protein [Enterococcus gilvus]MBX8937886.1 hypothetical protein [Enterococcus gilvus]